jgi:S-adenosylmethionine decarboxylase
VPVPSAGIEWLVDAHGCDAEALGSLDTLATLFASIAGELGLQPAADPLWRVLPDQAGIAGLLLLGESHLSCHTFPERGLAAFDLYSREPRHAWPWAERLATQLGAREVVVRELARGERPPGPA